MMKTQSVRLGTLCEVKGGKRLPSGETYAPDVTAHPYLRVVDFRNRTIDESDLKYISDETHSKIARYVISSDDVYVSIAGTIGVIGSVPEHLSGANLTANAARLVIRDKSALFRDYLVHFLSTVGQSYIGQKKMATSQPKLALFRLEEIEIPLPPLPKQRQIAAILDKADTVRRKRGEGIRLSEELLCSTFVEMFGDPVANPKGWPIRRLEEINGDMTYGTSVKCDSENGGSALPVLRIPNILHGRIDWTDLKYASLESRETEQLLLTPGDLLFVRTNGNPEYIGRCAMFSGDTRALFASYLIRVRLRPDAEYRPEFVRFVATMPSYRSLMVTEARTTAGNYNISTQGLRRLKLIAPPLEQQDRFLRFAAKTSRILAKREEATAAAAALFDSLVQRAFSGDL